MVSGCFLCLQKSSVSLLTGDKKMVVGDWMHVRGWHGFIFSKIARSSVLKGKTLCLLACVLSLSHSAAHNAFCFLKNYALHSGKKQQYFALSLGPNWNEKWKMCSNYRYSHDDFWYFLPNIILSNPVLHCTDGSQDVWWHEGNISKEKKASFDNVAGWTQLVVGVEHTCTVRETPGLPNHRHSH